MKRMTPLAEARATDALVIDADGIPFDAGALKAKVSALELDTGRRSIPLRTGATGQVIVQRQGDRVSVRLLNVVPPAGSFAVIVADLPAGFRPAGDTPLLAANFNWSSPASVYVARAEHNLYWVRALPDSSTRPTAAQSGEVTFRTMNAWPTSLPGEPA